MSDIKFIVDNNVGKLARWLRMMGYDTLFFNGSDDSRMVATALNEGRVILTRDTQIMRRRVVVNGQLKAILIQSDKPELQMRQVIETLKLNGCRITAPRVQGTYVVGFSIDRLKSDRRLNWIGLTLAGGLASATALDVTVTATMEVVKDGEVVYSESRDVQNSPPEIYSGAHSSRGVKKRAVQITARRYAARSSQCRVSTSFRSIRPSPRRRRLPGWVSPPSSCSASQP